MVRIPVYDNERPLNVGSEFFRPLNSREAERDLQAGYSSLGRGIGVIADELHKSVVRDEKFQADAAILDFNDVASKIIEDETKNNLPRDGRGFHDKVMPKIADGANKLLESLPDSQRQAGELRLQASVYDYSRRLSQIEDTTNRTFVSNVTQQSMKRISDNLSVGAWDMKRAGTEIDLFVKDAGLSPINAAAAREVMLREAQTSRIEYLRTSRPEMFTKEFGKYLTDAPSAAATPLQKLMAEQARAYGVDVRQMLLTAQLESANDPAAGGKGTVKGLFQMTRSERIRIAAKLGVSEEAILKDPGTASAGMAILLKEQTAWLENNGVPANPTTLYMSHFLGKSGAVHFYNADPNADAYTLYSRLDPKAVAAGAFKNNGELLREGMTVGQVIAAIDKRVQGGMKEVDKALVKDPSIDQKAPVELLGERFDKLQPGDIIGPVARAQADVVKRNNDRLTELAKQQPVNNDLPSNPYDSTWRKSEDDREKAGQHGTRILSGDSAMYAEYLGYAQRHGYLPAGVSAAALKMINTPGDPAGQLRGYELLAQVNKQNPIDGLRLSRIGGDQDSYGSNNAAKVRDYVNLTTHLGYGADPTMKRAAIEQIERSHSEDWKVKDARVAKDREDFVRGRTFREVSDSLGLHKWGIPFIRSGVDARPQNQAVQNRVEEMYQDRVRFWYTDTGNREVAKANALADVSRAVGYTRLGGRSSMTVHPPELNYPPALPMPTNANGEPKKVRDLTDKELTERFGYIHDQAKAQALAALPPKARAGIKDGDIYLLPSGNTKRDIESGQLPRYSVDVRVNGEFRRVTDNFMADPMLARDSALDEDKRVTRGTPKAPVDPNRRDLFKAKRGN